MNRARLAASAYAGVEVAPLCTRRDWASLVLLLLLPLALLLPGLSRIPFPGGGAEFSDLAITHLPYAETLRQALLEGRFPLWNASILSGAPFAANPLAGLWYLPGWPALLFPLPLGFNLMILAHLAWGGWGLYFLLRREGLGQRAALFGATAWVWLPKLWAHYGAGHLTLLYAQAWTPWLLWMCAARGDFLDAANEPVRADRPPIYRGLSGWVIFGEAVLLALIFTADPRWAAYAGMLWMGYALARRGPKPAWREALRLAGQISVALLLAAPLAVPMLEYASLSTRAAMSAADWTAFSLPPRRLLGLLYPDWGGFHEYSVYIGQLTLALVVAAVAGSSRPGCRFWIAAGAAALLWSLGGSLPLFDWIARLPGLSLLRVPARAMFVFGLAAACLAAFAVDDLLKRSGRYARRTRLALTGLLGISLALALGAAWITGGLQANLFWGGAFLLGAVILIGLRLGGHISGRVLLPAAAALLSVDLLVMNISLFQTRPPAELLVREGAAAKTLAASAGEFRVYSPSYSLPQEAAAFYDLELADGVDPLQLEAYAAYMEKASGVPRAGYSVTLPPMAGGADPAQANAMYTPDAQLLGLLNVGAIAADYTLDAPGLELQSRAGGAYIYSNLRAHGWAWVQPGIAAAEPLRPAAVRLRTPERIELAAEGPGVLVLSEIAYPGWKVSVDDRPAEVLTAYDLLRAVELPPGPQRVTFMFRPLSVWVGLALWAVGVLLIVAAALLRTAAEKSARQAGAAHRSLGMKR